MVADRDSLVGEPVGGSYVITKLLGEGGMGAVYLASSQMLAGKPAAVKVLLAECSEDPESMSRFRAEVFAAGKIHDPNIVKVFDAGHLPDGRMYMLMEYCSGGSLEELLERKGALPLDEIVNLIGPVASVLDEAHHEAKITHRDIKPANILLVQEPGSPLRSRLGDFGIAKLHFDKIDARTGTKSIMGSPGYMAPEQCDAVRGSGAVDHRADVYALASVLYQMTTGRRPYLGNSLYQLIESVANNRPIPRPRTLRPELPQECDDAIMAGLAHNREARIQTVKELVSSFAAGVPNGDAMLAYVAPRLVRSTLAPTAKTISGAIGPAALQWTAAVDASARAVSAKADTTSRRTRTKLGLVMAALAVGGLSAGVLLERVRNGRKSAPIVAGASIDAPVVQAAASQVASPRVVSIDAPPAADAPAVAMAPPPVDATRPSLVIDAPIDARPIMVDAAVANPIVTPSTKPPAPKPQIKAAPTTGTLLVRVEPFADVSIDGVAKGPAPINTQLSAGPHEIVLVGPSRRREVVTIRIVAGKKTVVERNW